MSPGDAGLERRSRRYMRAGEHRPAIRSCCDAGNVASWRDRASEIAQSDLDGLLSAALPFAEQTLAKYGEMFPFGAGVNTAGEVIFIAADPGLGEHPPSTAILETLYESARSDADLRAAAFVADVLAEGKDAVQVELEHADGIALTVIVPYSRRRLTKKVKLGPMRLVAGQRRVWSS
jgi:hypothetical protein